MKRAIADYYRCPEDMIALMLEERLPAREGFFRFGPDATCYGQCSTSRLSSRANADLYDVLQETVAVPEGVRLPFDLANVIDNLRLERYRWRNGSHPADRTRMLRELYYLLRPLTPESVRIAIQKIYYTRRVRIAFPAWPLDTSVDRILRAVMALLLQSERSAAIPFIWFWPNGFPACAIMTHDVETVVGRDFCPTLMSLNESFDITAAFQIIPESRYPVSETFLDAIRSRGFEINIHDLNHDGRLFRDRQTFLKRAERINHYARLYGASGFRAGAMYRRPEWFDALAVSYDMSIPNMAHMEPQRGGCCTVMPFFVNRILELPLTATQDFALFKVLRQYTTELWKCQMDLICAQHGLVSFIVHPDYMTGKREQRVYCELLTHLCGLRSERKLWIAAPKDVNDWWRQRAQMRLVQHEGRWVIEGAGSERARVAYAELSDGRLTYALAPQSDTKTRWTQERT